MGWDGNAKEPGLHPWDLDVLFSLSFVSESFMLVTKTFLSFWCPSLLIWT